ncbi:hypothetical protein C8R46DRAFT_1087658 [Mycena filopes]|nr:hypothetical protein C8R46DRAFT_1087658 [Mycena filopes]
MEAAHKIALLASNARQSVGHRFKAPRNLGIKGAPDRRYSPIPSSPRATDNNERLLAKPDFPTPAGRAMEDNNDRRPLVEPDEAAGGVRRRGRGLRHDTTQRARALGREHRHGLRCRGHRNAWSVASCVKLDEGSPTIVAAPPLEVILPTNPYFYNYFLQYVLNAASESAPVNSQQPRARPVLREDLPSISELTQTQPPTAPYPAYTITPACIPPESWLQEALHISHLPHGSIAAPTTGTKRPPHPHFARSTLFSPRIRRSKRKDGDIRDRNSYSTNGPRLTPREVPPLLSAQEEDNIRKLVGPYSIGSLDDH